MIAINVIRKNSYTDGGTIKWQDPSTGIVYYEDHRLFTQTEGAIYDRYPKDPGAKILDVVLFEIED